MVNNREVMDATQAAVFSQMEPLTLAQQIGAAAFAIVGFGLVIGWFIYEARKIMRASAGEE